jgi:hypothetical protein
LPANQRAQRRKRCVSDPSISAFSLSAISDAAECCCPRGLQGLHCPEAGEAGGSAATSAMRGLTRGQHVTCSLTGERSYDRMIGTCYVGDRPDGRHHPPGGVRPLSPLRHRWTVSARPPTAPPHRAAAPLPAAPKARHPTTARRYRSGRSIPCHSTVTGRAKAAYSRSWRASSFRSRVSASTTKTLRQIRSLGYARQPWCIIRAR